MQPVSLLPIFKLPSPLGRKGNEELARAIAQTPGAIGQESVTDLYYARLPKGLAERTAEKLKQVQIGK